MTRRFRLLMTADTVFCLSSCAAWFAIGFAGVTKWAGLW